MPNEPVEVHWQVADDEKMSKIVQGGSTVAVPDWAHSVHVEVEGLSPDRWYWYQFRAGNETSPVGRTRTMPADGMLTLISAEASSGSRNSVAAIPMQERIETLGLVMKVSPCAWVV